MLGKSLSIRREGPADRGDEIDVPALARVKDKRRVLLMVNAGPRGRNELESLMSMTTRRSGVANAPPFDRWPSPHACTRTQLTAVVARSAAMLRAAPR
jgi:hypothetical protein